MERRQEELRFEKLMQEFQRQCAARDMQKVVRGHFGRLVAADERAMLRAALMVQGSWRMKKSRMVVMFFGAVKLKKTMASVIIQAGWRGRMGRKLAHFRKRMHKIEERERLLNDRDYVLALQLRRAGSAMAVQRWFRNRQMRGGKDGACLCCIDATDA